MYIHTSPHAGRIPGDKRTQFPFNCTLDQIFRVKRLYNAPRLTDAAGAAYQLSFREYNLLENPRVPAAVFASQGVVVADVSRPAAAGDCGSSAKCVVAGKTSRAKLPPGMDLNLGHPNNGALAKADPAAESLALFTVPANLTATQVVSALKAATAGVSLLRFPDIVQVFGGLADKPELDKKFQAFLDDVTTHWCCRDNPEVVKWGRPLKVKLNVTFA